MTLTLTRQTERQAEQPSAPTSRVTLPNPKVADPTTTINPTSTDDTASTKIDADEYHRLLESVDLDAFAAELDEVRAEVIQSLGPDDADYIRRLIRGQRGLDVAGRAALWAGIFPPAWLAGVSLLSLAKILENMEIGHNVMHGQWDWLDDEDIHSTTWEWDHVCPSSQWKHSHNEIHHQWTSIEGVDHDLGYRAFRINEDQKHHSINRYQPIVALGLAAFFEYGIALHDVDGLGLFGGTSFDADIAQPKLGESLTKMRNQAVKDFVAFPALSFIPFGPLGVVASATGAATANVVRNVWSFAVIFCGHFPDDVVMFPPEAADDQRQGAWYLRQVLGSANFEGGDLMHLMTGNLDHQIEHHLFPDLPSNRYPEIAPKVQAICESHGIAYNTGSFQAQLASVARKIWRLRKP